MSNHPDYPKDQSDTVFALGLWKIIKEKDYYDRDIFFVCHSHNGSLAYTWAGKRTCEKCDEKAPNEVQAVMEMLRK